MSSKLKWRPDYKGVKTRSERVADDSTSRWYEAGYNGVTMKWSAVIDGAIIVVNATLPEALAVCEEHGGGDAESMTGLGQYLKDALKRMEDQPFVIKPCYEDDELTVIFEGVNGYGVGVGNGVMILRASDDDRIIGVCVAGIQELMVVKMAVCDEHGKKVDE